MLNIEHLTYTYKDSAQKMQFSFSVKPGEICAVLGTSGAGKSTLLSLLAGFLVAESGSVTYNREDFLSMEPHLRPLSILLQSNNLFPQLNVEENIGLGLDPNLKLTLEQKQSIELVSKQLGLDGFLKRRPKALSGGQQQRVAIARVLVRSRPILLLDEAFSALDPKLKEEMLEILKQLTKERQMCVVMVTHSPEEALKVADSFILVKDGQVIVHDNIHGLHDAKKDAVIEYLGR